MQAERNALEFFPSAAAKQWNCEEEFKDRRLFSKMRKVTEDRMNNSAVKKTEKGNGIMLK